MRKLKFSLVKIVAVLVIAELLINLSLISGAAVSQNLTFNPTADSYVDAANPTTNYGTLTTLRVDNSPVVNSYLRFSVTGVGTQSISQAQLRIHANSASTHGLAVQGVADTTWTEGTITSANAPAMGSTLASSPAVVSGTWVSLDVTAYVNGDGIYSFGVSTPGSTAISLASRESGANAPQLIVTVNSVPTPISTGASSSTPTATNITGQNPVFTPAADSYVDAANPGNNYGTLTTLRVDNSPVVSSYLRFSVSGLGGQVISQALLRIHANSASAQGLVARSVADNTWSEGRITSANAPAMGGALATSPAVVSGTWVILDVTSYVKSEGTYSFGVTTPGSTAISLASRESGANAPQLALSLNGSSTPVVTNTPTKTVVKTNTPTATGVKTNTPTASLVKTSTPTATLVKTSTPVPPTATPGAPTQTSTSTGSCTPVILTKGPTLIFTGDNTKMRIFWQWTSNATFQVQWGTTTAYAQGNVAVNPSDTTNHLYQYDISGLTPGTKYYYRDVVGSQCSGGTFYAAPASSATDIKFFSYGDTRTNGSIHNGLAGQVDAIFQADPAFQTLNLNVGDWVSADSSSAWSSEWFATSYTSLRTQDANISDIGNRGNHEGAATFWKQYWPEPFLSGGLYWSFDYGPMHVAVLDQYTAYGAGSAQYNWLKADLAASTKAWKFVMLHEPGWSAGGGHANNTTVQNDLQPLFLQYGVAIVFGGHNHYYARASVNGVTHLTLGGGGAPQYTPVAGQPNIVTYSKSYSFGEFTISGNTLTAKIVNNSGATIDSFTLSR